MIAVVAGMQRSASTFSFNVVREALENRGGCFSAPPSVSLIDALSACPHDVCNLILKTHSPDPLTDMLLARGAVKCVCTIRKPEDAIASWIDTFDFGLDESIETYAQWLAWHRSVAGHVLNVAFEEVERAPLLAVLKIGRYVASNFSLKDALRVWLRYRKAAVYEMTRQLDKAADGIVDVGFSHYDRATFFHRRHVSSMRPRAVKDVLSPADVLHVRQGLKDYVDADGNYHWAAR